MLDIIVKDILFIIYSTKGYISFMKYYKYIVIF